MKERNSTIDATKFLCILGVICIHTVPFSGTYLGTIINTISRVCVPLFFIFSGYFLYYNKNSKQYIIKYIKNLIKILILWTCIYILYDIGIMMISNVINYKSIFIGVADYLSQFKVIDLYYSTGIVKYHLWYLSSMIIIVPILYLIISKNLLDIAIKCTLCLNLVGVLLPVLVNQELSSKVRDSIFFGLFYCTLGTYMNKYEIQIKEKIINISKFKYVVIVLFLLGISMIEKFIYIVMFDGCGDYLISTIPLSIFIFCVSLRNKNICKNKIINQLGKETIGIYLIHPLIIQCILLIIQYKLSSMWILNTIMWELIYTPIVLILSYLIYSIIRNTLKRVHRLKEGDNKCLKHIDMKY